MSEERFNPSEDSIPPCLFAQTGERGDSGFGRKRNFHRQSAFTLIELIVVIAICGILGVLVAYRIGAFTFWKEEAFIRRLAETMEFLHHQAVTDQAFYRVEFNFDNNSYSVGVIKPNSDVNESLSLLASSAGTLSIELAAFLSPAIGRDGSLIPPPSFPSMADPQELPEKMRYLDVRTMRGVYSPEDADSAYILFSPRGFSEFAVVHLKLSNGKDISILVNPFTGLTEIRREYVDYEWTYGKGENSSQ